MTPAIEKGGDIAPHYIIINPNLQGELSLDSLYVQVRRKFVPTNSVIGLKFIVYEDSRFCLFSSEFSHFDGFSWLLGIKDVKAVGAGNIDMYQDRDHHLACVFIALGSISLANNRILDLTVGMKSADEATRKLFRPDSRIRFPNLG